MPPFSFAQRVDWELKPNALSQALASLKERHIDIFDLTTSNPTACGFDYPSHWFKTLSHPDVIRYQPEAAGCQASREAIAGYYQSRGSVCSPNDLLLTASSSEAYSYVFRLLCDAGDCVAIPSPSYPLFQYLTQLNDVEPLTYTLSQQGDQWRVDQDSLLKVLDQGARAVLVVNPNNPTGSWMTFEDYNVVSEMCAARNVAVIIDEVFYDYAWDSEPTVLPLGDDQGPLTFVINGLSKMLALPQMKLSWLWVSGPLDMKRQGMAKLEVIADTFLSVNTPVQYAAPEWIQDKALIQDQIMARCCANYNFLTKEFGIRCLPVKAGWSAVIDLGVRDEEAWFTRLLQEHHVYLHPGYFFDFLKDGYAVVSLLTYPDILKQGVARLKAAL